MRKLFVFNILVLFLLLLSSFGCASYPSDKYLVENFQNNSADFEKLVKMIQEDKQVISVTKNGEVLNLGYQKKDNILSNVRLNEYQVLLNKINALEIRVRTNNMQDNSKFTSIDFSVYKKKAGCLELGEHLNFTFLHKLHQNN